MRRWVAMFTAVMGITALKGAHDAVRRPSVFRLCFRTPRRVRFAYSRVQINVVKGCVDQYRSHATFCPYIWSALHTAYYTATPLQISSMRDACLGGRLLRLC